MGTPDDLSWVTSADAKKFISQMTKREPQHFSKMMPGADEAAFLFVSNMLILNPHKRSTISQVIAHSWMKELARGEDYKKCPEFDIAFEYEARMKMNFGVRHVIYKELTQFHESCQKHENK